MFVPVVDTVCLIYELIDCDHLKILSEHHKPVQCFSLHRAASLTVETSVNVEIKQRLSDHLLPTVSLTAASVFLQVLFLSLFVGEHVA